MQLRCILDASTLRMRIRKRLLDPVNWFKDKDAPETGDEKEEGKKGKKRKIRVDETEMLARKKVKKDDAKAVLFCPNTSGGELAKKLREVEEDMERSKGFRIKVVEEAGEKILDILHSANP